MNNMSAPDRVNSTVRISMRRIVGLDGLRAIATGLVLVFHLIPGWAGIGYIGVDIFFVLSGFLITSLLIVSSANHGGPRLADFWRRRFRRLFPAVFVATIGASALAVFAGADARVALGRQVLGSLTATYNWIEIASGSSYFEQASPLLFTNMWSLAVEQQFYLFWPIIVVLLLRRRTRWRIAVSLAIAAGSIALHIVLLGEDVTRSYMGTDTHLWGLMFGACLAFAMSRTVVGRHELAASPRSAQWGRAGWVGILVIMAAGMTIPDSLAMYPWAMVAASALTVLVIRALLPDVQSAESSALRAVLGSRILSWIGVRSYGIYLWHWPLFVIFYYRLPLLDPMIVAAAVAVLSVIVAHLSFTYIEDPIRRMGLRPWLASIRDRISRLNPAGAIASVTAPLLVLSLAGAATITAPAVSSAQQAVEDGGKADSDIHAPEGTPDANPETISPTPGGGAQSTTPPTPEAPDPTPEPTPAFVGPATWDEVTIIGDSIVLASQYSLSEAMPGVVIDAAESRSIQAAPTIIAQHAANGTLGNYVVVSLATNGAISDGNVDAVLDAVGPERKVVFVTAFGPPRASWIPDSNRAIASAAQRHPDRVLVADWYTAIADHTDLLAGDAVHPGREGAKIYAETIRTTLTP